MGMTKGRHPIQDQSSVLGADILNSPRNKYIIMVGVSKSTKHQSDEFRCFWEVKLCNN